MRISIVKRKGGGGRSSGGGSVSSGSSSSSGRTGSSSSSSSSSSSGSTKGYTPGTASGGSRVFGSSSGRGIGSPYAITSGAFAGRQAGGGTRGNIYSGGGYGSGYTNGYTNRGRYGGPVGGLGFPFIFWPIGFGGYGYGNYYGNRELNNDTERPGGEMTQYTLLPPSNVTDASANNFALLGDINSVDSVYQSLIVDCGVMDTLGSNFTVNPDQTAAYYRGSSFALLLDGYDNGQPNITDTDGNSTQVTTPLAPLPSTVDTAYFNCLNTSIGNNVPLVDATSDGALSSKVAPLHVILCLPALLVALLLSVL